MPLSSFLSFLVGTFFAPRVRARVLDRRATERGELAASSFRGAAVPALFSSASGLFSSAKFQPVSPFPLDQSSELIVVKEERTSFFPLVDFVFPSGPDPAGGQRLYIFGNS